MAKNLGIDLEIYPQLREQVIKAIKDPIPDDVGFVKTSKNEILCINLRT